MNSLRTNANQFSSPLSPSWLRLLVIVLLLLGVTFRFVNLNHKVYWHDEVYTSMRAAGYTVQDIQQDAFQNRLVSVHELQQFQRLKPGSTPVDTVRSLALEDPQHPPVYFLITRFWMQVLGEPLESHFGSLLTVTRSLPAVISLIALPLMSVLAWELFASRAVALLAMAFLALSPFDVLFAQTARQYSLLTLAVILSHYLLLRAMRLTRAQNPHSLGGQQRPLRWQPWVQYGLAVTLGFYTHPLFGLTIMGHGIYVGLEARAEPRPTVTKRFISGTGLAMAGAIVLYSPWIYVMLKESQRLISTTNWADIAPGWDYLVKLWVLSFTALFIDLDFGFDSPWTYVLRGMVLVLLGVSLYTLCRRCDRSVWLFVLVTLVVPFLSLALPDLILGGKRSAVSRYLIPCYPSVQLAIAYFLATKLSPKPHYMAGRSTPGVSSHYYHRAQSQTRYLLNRWSWRGGLGLLLGASLASLLVSAASFTWWNRDISYYNGEIAHRLNMATAPIVVSDLGDDYTNLGDLISLSYLLHPNVRLLLLNQDVDWIRSEAFMAQTQDATIAVFRPSKALRQALESSQGTLQPLLPIARVWQLPSH